MSKDMSTNPIEDLRHLESPVTDQEWSAILQDKRYTQKFGRKPGPSPKGRAAIVAGVAAALIAIPILVKTLSHAPTEEVQEAVPTITETTVPETHTNAETTINQPISETGKSSVLQTVKSQDAPTLVETTTSDNTTAPAVPIVPEAKPESNAPLAEMTPTPEPAPRQTPSTPDVQNARSSTPSKNGKREQTSTPTTTDHASDETAVAKYDASPEEPVSETEKFFIPSAFTPNGDGLNDLFYVKANFEPHNFEMTIMTRNGDLLFHSRDMNIGWDGQTHGRTLPQGMYVYIIKYKDSKGNDQKQQGQILLIP